MGCVGVGGGGVGWGQFNCCLIHSTEETIRNLIQVTALTCTTRSRHCILDKLIDAQNQSRFLGLKLNIPMRDIDAIQSKYNILRSKGASS